MRQFPVNEFHRAGALWTIGDAVHGSRSTLASVPLLDVVLGYDCNLACDYCTITPAMRRRALATREVVVAMRRAREDGYDAISFTGGEPTIRGDLLPLICEARRLGFADVKLQTNGLLLTEPNLRRLEEAGVTRVNLSVHTHRADLYDALVQREGSYDAMRAGLRALAASELDATADLIMNATTAPHLPDAVRWVAGHGISEAQLWLVSLTDGNRDRVDSLPPMEALMPHVAAAFEAAEDAGLVLWSLHLPKCVLGRYADRSRDPAAGGVRLLTPDDERDLADAKLTPGTYVAACVGCPERGACRGLRPDYLEVHGDAAVAHARGQTPDLAPTRLAPTRLTVIA